MPSSLEKRLLFLNPSSKVHQKIALLIIAVVHFFGILGLSYAPVRPYFEAATPFSLIVTSALLFAFHHEWNLAFGFFIIFTYTLGFLVEVAGVHTASIFGSYAYGATLGLKLWEVPLMIGLNWLMLTYACGSVSEKISDHPFLNSVAGSVMMVLLDILIEPVAIKLDFWQWQGGKIPLQNFVGWFVTALILQLVFHYLRFDKKNILAKYVLSVQAIFFIILQIAI